MDKFREEAEKIVDKIPADCSENYEKEAISIITESLNRAYEMGVNKKVFDSLESSNISSYNLGYNQAIEDSAKVALKKYEQGGQRAGGWIYLDAEGIATEIRKLSKEKT